MGEWANPPKEVYFRLSWIGHQSTNFRKEIIRVIDKGFFNVNTRVVFTTNRALSGRAKDTLPTTSLSSVVYEYTCRCERAYVGRTSQCLSERIKQHVPATLLQARPVLRKAKTYWLPFLLLNLPISQLFRIIIIIYYYYYYYWSWKVPEGQERASSAVTF